MGEVNFQDKKDSLPVRGWVIPLAVAGLVALGATTIYSLKFANSQTEAPVVPETAAIKAVSGLGRIEPVGEVIKLAPPPIMGGAKVTQLLVEEGDEVKAGQVIVVLDNNELQQAAVKQAEEEVAVARGNLAIIQAGAKTGEIKAQEAEIERLKAQLQGEIATNQAKIAGLEAQLARETEEKKATIGRLRAEFNNAATEFTRYDKLAAEGAISASELDDRRLTLDTGKESLVEAEATLKKSVETLGEEIKEATAIAQQSVNTLEKEIIAAEAELNRIAEVRGVDVQKAEAEVNREIANLQQAKAELELTSVKTPITGKVLKIHTRPGESVKEDDGIVELGQTENMMVVAEIYESDISKIKLGHSATITSENGSFDGELQGTVNHIGMLIGKQDVLDADPAGDVDARVVEVKILLDRESSRQVANLTYAKVLVKILL
ncbi:MAG: biotin/lipoyl-binding protein [Gomphosphaeria aponina SAG 52.96 = DSM 107014]|uniref:Biotin/lipoyl-binding protein n=1 Tax=Gomphosphaeria aponina SAG 52.96 = DSM 107014 TaxID=1521640 RepID=A0A941GQ13_9CHRO|nr:biotin/lipoyl-binding protein [Gomphosphaeria aponina SAG 52.96 = DSM 107014]